MKNIIKIISFAYLLFLCISASAQSSKKTTPQKISTNKKVVSTFPNSADFKDAKLSFKIIPAPNKTWGYDILNDGKVIIHQSSIPGVAGINGFSTEAKAEKVANLVVSKIQKGEMPPTVSQDEMNVVDAL